MTMVNRLDTVSGVLLLLVFSLGFPRDNSRLEVGSQQATSSGRARKKHGRNSQLTPVILVYGARMELSRVGKGLVAGRWGGRSVIKNCISPIACCNQSVGSTIFNSLMVGCL